MENCVKDMNFIDKLERRFGGRGIQRLIVYVLGISVFGNLLNLVNSSIYPMFLSFDVYKILHGQVWRLVTFLMAPSVSRDSGLLVDLIWYAIWLSLYYFIGMNLENMWGSFRFTLYYLFGIVVIWIVAFAGYFIDVVQMGGAYAQLIGYNLGSIVSVDYLNTSLFLAFASMFPDIQFLLYFIIPVKAKWLGILDAVFMGYQMVRAFYAGVQGYFGGFFMAALIAGAFVTFGLFYLVGRGGNGGPAAAYHRRKKKKVYRQRAAAGSGNGSGGPIHRCAICGRTEQDAPELEFRYCSKCEGNYEYCSDHLFTHVHVHK